MAADSEWQETADQLIDELQQTKDSKEAKEAELTNKMQAMTV